VGINESIEGEREKWGKKNRGKGKGERRDWRKGKLGREKIEGG